MKQHLSGVNFQATTVLGLVFFLIGQVTLSRCENGQATTDARPLAGINVIIDEMTNGTTAPPEGTRRTAYP